MWAASIARFIEYAGATGLFGAALFFLALLPPDSETSARQLTWSKPLLLISSGLLLFGTLLSLAAQAASMNGIALLDLDVPSVSLVLFETGWGHAIAVRLALSVVAFIVAIVSKPSPALWWSACLLGALLLASFAWTGHGAATEGAGGLFHLLADIIHLIAAGTWLGVLAAFLSLICLPTSPDRAHQTALLQALKRFSGLGSALVAILVLSGLVNSWFLIGVDHLSLVFASPYGLLLVAKLAFFAGMLAMAAKNRFHLTPRLQTALDDGRAPTQVLHDLRSSILVETLAGIVILGLISVMGMLEPMTSL